MCFIQSCRARLTRVLRWCTALPAPGWKERLAAAYAGRQHVSGPTWDLSGKLHRSTCIRSQWVKVVVISHFIKKKVNSLRLIFWFLSCWLCFLYLWLLIIVNILLCCKYGLFLGFVHVHQACDQLRKKKKGKTFFLVLQYNVIIIIICKYELNYFYLI